MCSRNTYKWPESKTKVYSDKGTNDYDRQRNKTAHTYI